MIDIPSQAVGALRFVCGRGMYGGSINFVAAGQATGASLGSPAVNPVCDAATASCLPAASVPERVLTIATVAPRSAAAASVDGAQIIDVSLVNGAYQPAQSRARAGVPSKLLMHTKNGFG